MPTAASSAPGRSSRAVEVERDSSSTFAPRTSATAETGTLIQKMVRQPKPNRSASTSSPPSSGPATEARPWTAP